MRAHRHNITKARIGFGSLHWEWVRPALPTTILSAARARATFSYYFFTELINRRTESELCLSPSNGQLGERAGGRGRPALQWERVQRGAPRGFLDLLSFRHTHSSFRGTQYHDTMDQSFHSCLHFLSWTTRVPLFSNISSYICIGSRLIMLFIR